jgi:hypothetical protein
LQRFAGCYGAVPSAFAAQGAGVPSHEMKSIAEICSSQSATDRELQDSA